MQEKLLGINVVVRALRVAINVLRGSAKPVDFLVPELVCSWLNTIVRCLLVFGSHLIWKNKDDLEIPRKHFGSDLLIIKVPKVNEHSYNHMLCFWSLFDFIHGIYEDVLLQSAVVHVSQSVDLVSIFNPMIIHLVKHSLKLSPWNQFVILQ